MVNYDIILYITEMKTLPFFMEFSSLAAVEVVILTTSSAASDENFTKMIFLFQWMSNYQVKPKIIF